MDVLVHKWLHLAVWLIFRPSNSYYLKLCTKVTFHHLKRLVQFFFPSEVGNMVKNGFLSEKSVTFEYYIIQHLYKVLSERVLSLFNSSNIWHTLSSMMWLCFSADRLLIWCLKKKLFDAPNFWVKCVKNINFLISPSICNCLIALESWCNLWQFDVVSLSVARKIREILEFEYSKKEAYKCTFSVHSLLCKVYLWIFVAENCFNTDIISYELNASGWKFFHFD